MPDLFNPEGFDTVHAGGEPRILSVLPPRPDFNGLPKYRAASPVLPRDQWQECDLIEAFDPPILDQDGTGSCVGHGSTTAFTLAWLMTGAPLVRFSSCFLYGLINGGRDGGAVIGDAMEALIETGIALESEVPEGMIYRSHFPQSAFATARKYRIGRAEHLENFDDIGSALTLRRPVALGFRVGNDINDLDAEGVAPVHRGEGNHCIAGGGLRKSRSGEWLIKCQNSWGERYGLKGRLYLREAHFTTETCDAFSVIVVPVHPDDDKFPPAAHD